MLPCLPALPPCPACLPACHALGCRALPASFSDSLTLTLSLLPLFLPPPFLFLATGYLPSFWIKLRLLAMPAVNSGALAAAVPAVLGGPTHLTVGLLACFVAVSCIIAADTGAYFTGKSFGRTQVRGAAGIDGDREGGRLEDGNGVCSSALSGCLLLCCGHAAACFSTVLMHTSVQQHKTGSAVAAASLAGHPCQACTLLRPPLLLGWLQLAAYLPTCLPALLQLTHVSPKKTVEGAVGGLLSSIAVALGLYKVGCHACCWAYAA